VLYKALAVVSDVAVAGIAAVVVSDMAVATGGSGCETRSGGVCRGAVGRLGSVCRRLQDAGGSFEVGNQVVVAAVDVADNVDRGCAGFISGDVAVLAGKGGLVMRAMGAGGSFSVWVAVSLVLVIVWVLKLVQSVVCAVADCHCRLSFACVAISWVLVLVWVLESMRGVVLDLSRVSLAFTACIILSNPSFAIRYPSSRPKFIPLSIPSSSPNFFPCAIPNFSPSSNARIQRSLRFLPSVVAAAQLQNWAMFLRSAISRKWRKSWQADVDLGAILVVPFAGDATAASGAVVRFFEDFF
jgi:hypothetical protein